MLDSHCSSPEGRQEERTISFDLAERFIILQAQVINPSTWCCLISAQ